MTRAFSTFVIGDVHGRADLLERTLTAISSMSSTSVDDYRIVFLGDIIDRGPHSRDALDMVMEELGRQPESVLLQGNHEELMLRFVLNGAEKQGSWLMNGGIDALASYGYGRNEYLDFDDFGKARIRQEFCERLQVEQSKHFDMLRRSKLYVEFDNHILVHAGIDPTLPLERQDAREMKWTKETPDHSCLGEKTVVHGHVVTDSLMPEIYDNRIAIDTGAFETGRLTTLLIRPGGQFKELYCTNQLSNGRIDFNEVQALDMRTSTIQKSMDMVPTSLAIA